MELKFRRGIGTLCMALMVSVSTYAQKDSNLKWSKPCDVNAEPTWFKDAKFGIYAHWGPVSSAFVGADPSKWYAGWHGMKMYVDGKIVPTPNGNPSNNYIHHQKKYGNPKKHGYVELIEKFDPSGFDAKEWADLFAKSGAQFAGPVAMHHDNFAMWDAKSTRWNSKNYGNFDPSAQLKKEIESHGMKFMASFHHAFTWQYFAPAHKHGGVKKKDYDLYTTPHSLDSEIPDARFNEEWWAKLKEYIDVYQPDLLWFDWWLENLPHNLRQKFLTYYYEQGKKWNKEVAVCYKETTFNDDVAIRDYERGRPNQPKEHVWLTDTSPGAWFYRPGAKFKTPNELIDILIDIVSKNGCMLLNVPPNPDGTIPDEMKNLLVDMGTWLQVNGDAIYGTRTWTIFGEGPTRLPAGGHKIEKHKIEYTNKDIRFTKKSDTEFYAIVMDKPEQEIVVEALTTRLGIVNTKIINVELLGSNEQLKWKRNERGLVVQAPKTYPTEYAHAFRITLEGYAENGIGGDVADHVD